MHSLLALLSKVRERGGGGGGVALKAFAIKYYEAKLMGIPERKARLSCL